MHLKKYVERVDPTLNAVTSKPTPKGTGKLWEELDMFISLIVVRVSRVYAYS